MMWSSCKEQSPTVDEWMQDPQKQDEVIDYILDDYPLMMKFLDKSVEHEQAQSMMLGHRHMMGMMMANHEMMADIMRKDTSVQEQMMKQMIVTLCRDSANCVKMAKMLDQYAPKRESEEK